MNCHRWSRNSKGSKSVHNTDVQKTLARRPLPKPHETEEEAIIRRFHDAQRMARFRAKRKKALQEAKALEEAGFDEIAVVSELKRRNITFEVSSSIECNNRQFQACLSGLNPSMVVQPLVGRSKYSQLLAVIEELGKDIRLTYAGSRTSAEKLKIGIVQARMLIKDCLLETKVNSQK